jgi:hypothetical protein
MRIALALLAALAALAIGVAAVAPAKSSSVLLVGKNGTYSTIQAAVNAAKPGDWILVAPGDYKGTVRITKDNIHLRGMSRNGVVVDGTKSGPACSSKASDQDFKRGDQGNGIEVLKASGVSIENLTACNFLGEGNQIWWNGGDGSGKIGMGSYHGAYLSATSTYFSPKKPNGSYGLFVSNARGPGDISHSYGSNMTDAAYYVGACHPCNTTLNHDLGEHSTLGYSGTNSSAVTIENSEFRDNYSGITTNSQNNDDKPSPQLGSTFKNNFIHDNNNPNVPSSEGNLRVVGTGLIVAGGRNNKVLNNRISHNGAWGVVVTAVVDAEKPPKGEHCQGGSYIPNVFSKTPKTLCFFDAFNNEVANNSMSNNGFFGNPTNGDLAEVSNQNPLGNCWHGNTAPGGGAVTSTPPDLQTTNGQCGVPNHGAAILSPLVDQLLCDTELLSKCKADATHKYPRTTKATAKPLPKLPGMRNPCAGVPANAFCSRGGQKRAPAFTG